MDETGGATSGWDAAPQRGRAARPGWVLLPQRVFLGATFTFAGLQKLADPLFFDPRLATSFQGQLTLFRETSPIGAVLGPVAANATLFGVLVALAEVAVGLGTLLGLWTRLAAAGGALLSLSFLLTVSWTTRPYYYGSDIVFLVAWLPLIWVGSAGVLSLDAALARRPVRYAGAPAPATRRLDRRTVATGLLAVGVLAVAGADAALGRLLGRDRAGRRPAAAPPTPPAGPTGGPPTTSATPGPTAAATAVGRASELPVGGALMFTEPGTGRPAYVVQPARGRFLAYSAICSHAGCTVGFAGGQRLFRCPCHGAVYDGETGAVRAGPAPAPLRRIPVQVVGDELRVSA